MITRAVQIKRMTVPNTDEHMKHPESSSAGENTKILCPTGNKAYQFITNSNTHILYDLRICFLDSAQGNIKPLPTQTCACMVRSSLLLQLKKESHPMPASYSVITQSNITHE